MNVMKIGNLISQNETYLIWISLSIIQFDFFLSEFLSGSFGDFKVILSSYMGFEGPRVSKK